jgi:hypothetical protein
VPLASLAFQGPEVQVRRERQAIVVSQVQGAADTQDLVGQEHLVIQVSQASLVSQGQVGETRDSVGSPVLAAIRVFLALQVTVDFLVTQVSPEYQDTRGSVGIADSPA